jgi:hypothetical protein
MPGIWLTEASYNFYELKFIYLKPTGLPPLNIKSGLGDAGDLAYGSKL